MVIPALILYQGYNFLVVLYKLAIDGTPSSFELGGSVGFVIFLSYCIGQFIEEDDRNRKK
jgi:hypothetical protein